MKIPQSVVIVEDDLVTLKRFDEHIERAFPGCDQRITKDVDRVLEEEGFLTGVDLLMINVEMLTADQCNDLIALVAKLGLSWRCVFMWMDDRWQDMAETMAETTGGIAIHKDAQAEAFFGRIHAHLKLLPPTAAPAELEAAAELPEDEDIIGEPMGG